MSEEKKQEQKQRRLKAEKHLLLKNIKYKGQRYKVGSEIEIDAEDQEAFVKAGIIKGE